MIGRVLCNCLWEILCNKTKLAILYTCIDKFIVFSYHVTEVDILSGLIHVCLKVHGQTKWKSSQWLRPHQTVEKATSCLDLYHTILESSQLLRSSSVNKKQNRLKDFGSVECTNGKLVHFLSDLKVIVS